MNHPHEPQPADCTHTSSRNSRKLVVVLLALGLTLSLGLNVAVLTVAPIFDTLSSLIETAAVTLPDTWKRQAEGRITVRQKHRRTVSALNSKLRKLEASIERQTRQVRKRAAHVSRRLKTRIAKRAARSVAAATGEAIPVAGIAIVVAATTWELYDACESMKDLAALDRVLQVSSNASESAATVCGLAAPTKESLWKTVRNSPAQAWHMASEALKLPTHPPPETVDGHPLTQGPGTEDDQSAYQKLREWLSKRMSR